MELVSGSLESIYHSLKKTPYPYSTAFGVSLHAGMAPERSSKSQSSIVRS
jgi:hypothetical protein